MKWISVEWKTERVAAVNSWLSSPQDRVASEVSLTQLPLLRLMPVNCFVEKYTYSSENNNASFIVYRLRKKNIYFIKNLKKCNWIKYTLVVRTLQVLTINCTYLAKFNSKVNIVFVLDNKVCCAVLVPFYNNSWFNSDTLKNPGSNSIIIYTLGSNYRRRVVRMVAISLLFQWKSAAL